MQDKKLSQAARDARAAYKREWNRKNPHKNKEYIARYWQRKTEKTEQNSTEGAKNE